MRLGAGSCTVCPGACAYASKVPYGSEVNKANECVREWPAASPGLALGTACTLGIPGYARAEQREKHVPACRHRRCFFGGAKGNRAGPGREAAATVLDEAELVVVDGDAVAAGGDGVVELVEKDAGQGRLRP